MITKKAMSFEQEDMSIEDMMKLIKESIKKGKGLISYRKHLALLFKLGRKLELLVDYRKGLVEDVDKEIHSLEESIDLIRENIKEAMTEDESIEKTDTGGKTVSLPDLGTISLSKELEKIVITDAQKVLERFGDKVQKITVSLDKTKAKAVIMETKEPIEGVEVEKYRELRVIKK